MDAIRILSAALLGLATPAAAQTPNVVERFVTAVKSGADFKTGEFASAVNPDDAVKLATLAKCIPDPPRTSSSGSSVMLLWDCSALPGTDSLGTMLGVENGKITSVFVMSAVIVPTRAQ